MSLQHALVYNSSTLIDEKRRPSVSAAARSFIQPLSELPTFTLQEEEHRRGVLSLERLEALDDAFEQAGCVLLHKLFPRALMQTLHDHFLGHYGEVLYAKNGQHQRVGDRRWMVTVALKGPFLQEGLFAPPVLEEWLQHRLGRERRIDSAGVVVSLPGADHQHEHRDLPELFDDQALEVTLPTYAVTMLIPLVDMNHEQGTTQVRLGSHKATEEQAISLPTAAPEVPAGSCLMMDYRLQHGGTANLSQTPRPLYYQVHARPWFRDHRNFQKQAPLCLTRWGWRKLTPTQRALFATATRTWW